MRVTNRDRERVGGVMRGRHGVETQQQLHHLLNLTLFGASVTNDGEFDLSRRVFDDRQAGVNGGEHSDTARMAKHEGALYVARVKQVFDDDTLRSAAGQQRRQLLVDVAEAIGERGAGRRRHRAAGNETMAAAVSLDAAIPGSDRPRIDPENPHASEASISFSSTSKFD